MKDAHSEMSSGNLEMRTAVSKDLPEIMGLYGQARKFMREIGNPDQWKEDYPTQSMIEQDIREGKCRVCEADEEMVGVFYFSPEEKDPDYGPLIQGKWLNEDAYGVIHRIAVSAKQKGVAAFCVDWCWSRCKNIRIDTHEDNVPMRRFLEKMGFQFCGILRLEDGSLRRGYQKSQ